MLACPLYKKDARRHRRCAAYTSRKISHVKQHIYRTHVQSPYCPRCGTTFERLCALNQHLMAVCTTGSFPEPDGITLQQRNALGRRVSPGLSLEGQWYAVFDIVCPGHPRPTSPYLDSELSEETFSALRLFFTGDVGVDIIYTTLARSGEWREGDEASLRDAISRGLGDLVDRWASLQSAEARAERLVERVVPTYNSSTGRSIPSTWIDSEYLHDSNSQHGTISSDATPSGGHMLVGQDSNSGYEPPQDSTPMEVGPGNTDGPGTAPVQIDLTDFNDTNHSVPILESVSDTEAQEPAILPHEDAALLEQLGNIDWLNVRWNA